MKKFPLITGLALSLLACSSVFAAEKTLRIGIEAAYPPFASKPIKAKSSVSTTTSGMLCAPR
jgi:arginine/ornithine transport system substrate-binding protein